MTTYNRNNSVYFFTSISVIIFIMLNTFAIYNLGINLIYFSFLCNIIMISFFILLLSVNRYLYFEASVIIFYIIFFIIAPISQINEGYFPNTFPIQENIILKSNLYLWLFTISYIFFRFIFIKPNNKKYELNIKNVKSIYIIYTFVFLIFFISGFKDIINSILYKVNTSDSDISSSLIRFKYIYVFPVFLLIYFISNIKKQEIKLNISIVLKITLLLMLLIFVKNPFLERRNSIGPLYISILLFIFFDNKINLRNFFIVMFLTLVILFPVSSVITNSRVGMTDMSIDTILKQINIIFKEGFLSLHYDAFASFNASIEYVTENGLSYGYQLLGVMLFFLPRSIWQMKPIGSGTLIGDYLINNYSLWFNNVSNPFPSEGYLNFGIVGIVLFAFILAKISKITEDMIRSKGYISFIGFYIVIYMIFILRGDLMSSYAYVFSFIMATWITPKLLDKIISNIKYNIK